MPAGSEKSIQLNSKRKHICILHGEIFALILSINSFNFVKLFRKQDLNYHICFSSCFSYLDFC